MAPVEGFAKELDEKILELIGKFVSDVKNGQLRGSANTALAMITLLEQIIAESQNATAFELVGAVRAAARRVSAALPHVLVAANMARRVLRAVRDENRALLHQSDEALGEGASLQRLVLAAGARRATLAAQDDLREPIREHIAELRGEVESSAAAIGGAARKHVLADELVLTFGASALAERFLRAAAPRRYRLVVAEGADVQQSHGMAARLSAAGVPVTVISSAAVGAVMARVNKVVLSVRAALGGGAVLVAPGALAVALAAHHYSVPVLALAPLYKLSPTHAHARDRLSVELAAPAHALPYERGESGAARALAPSHDVLPPHHVALFITNLGGSSPSYMYRMLSELYDPADYAL